MPILVWSRLYYFFFFFGLLVWSRLYFFFFWSWSVIKAVISAPSWLYKNKT